MIVDDLDKLDEAWDNFKSVFIEELNRVFNKLVSIIKK